MVYKELNPQWLVLQYYFGIDLLGIPVEDTLMKLEYDFYYIKHMSLGLDTLILLQSLKSVFMSFEEG